MSDPYRKDDIRKSPEELERIAASLCDTPDEMEGDAPDTITQLRARIKDLEAAQGARVPEGYVLVPKEPTRAMVDAAGGEYVNLERADDPSYEPRDLWKAMLAASPPAPSAPSREQMTDQGAIKRAIESAIHFAEGADGGEDRDGNTIFTDDLLAELYAALTEVSRSGGGCNFPACSCKPGAMCSCVVGSSRALQNDGPLREALRWIQQRANESGTGEMGLIDTIHAMHKRATDALATPSGNVTDDMVERAAIKLHEIARQQRTAGKRGIPRWETELPEYRDHLRSNARAALHSALGQGEE